MYGIDTPEDFAQALESGDMYWSDKYDKPNNVEIHPQGQVYIRFDEDESAHTVTYLLKKINVNGLRAEVEASNIAIFNPRPTCNWDGCHAKSKGSKPYRDLCPTHAGKAKFKKPAGVRAPEFYEEA